MPNSTETTKKAGHKTNNSQPAGMSSGASSIPVIALSIPQGMPQTDAFLEAEDDNARQITEDILNPPSGGQSAAGLGDPEGKEEEDSRSEYSLALGDFRELTELGSPY